MTVLTHAVLSVWATKNISQFEILLGPGRGSNDSNTQFIAQTGNAERPIQNAEISQEEKHCTNPSCEKI